MEEPNNHRPEEEALPTKKSVCALLVAMLPDGAGLKITPVSPADGWTERVPTMFDIRAIANDLLQELQVHMHIGVVSKMQESQRSKGLIERVRGRFGR